MLKIARGKSFNKEWEGRAEEEPKTGRERTEVDCSHTEDTDVL